MTARFLALYETPADPEAFDRHYREIHIPLVRRLPGLRRYMVSRDITAVHGAPYYLVAELDWDTMDELRAAFASPEGRATAADAARLQELAPVRRMIFTADDGRASTRSFITAAISPGRDRVGNQPRCGVLPGASAHGRELLIRQCCKHRLCVRGGGWVLAAKPLQPLVWSTPVLARRHSRADAAIAALDECGRTARSRRQRR